MKRISPERLKEYCSHAERGFLGFGEALAEEQMARAASHQRPVTELKGNFILPAFPGLIVKDSYRRWPERNLAGNAIDFHVQVLGLSFHNDMRHLTGV